jgi:hypothetical protein
VTKVNIEPGIINDGQDRKDKKTLKLLQSSIFREGHKYAKEKMYEYRI